MSHDKSHPLVIAAVLFLWMSCNAAGRHGRPFFIDPAAGSDQADGLTERTPWRSAERLQGSPLVPGDRVLFKAGTTHRGTVSVSGAGDAQAPVLIGRYGDPGFLVSPGSSLNTSVRPGSAALDAGFKPFDLSKAGLPPGSPWREHARAARGR